MARLDDLSHIWGGDLQLSPTGDLARADGPVRSQQRVLRRLMTGATEYLWEPTYGAGLPQKIGENLNLPEIRGRIRGQMLLEASVARVPAPEVKVREITGGVAAAVQYVALPDKQPVSLTFDLTE
jgi:hypothetical protein